MEPVFMVLGDIGRDGGTQAIDEQFAVQRVIRETARTLLADRQVLPGSGPKESQIRRQVTVAARHNVQIYLDCPCRQRCSRRRRFADAAAAYI